jgi:3-dehydroquinate synthase
MFENFSVASRIREHYSVKFTQQFEKDLESAPENSIIILDGRIAKLYANKLESILAGRAHVLLDCKEENKTLDYCKEVIAQLLDHKVRKNHVLVAIGGGITQDIVAFISSVLFRGVDWIFFPTTLLAQCDSCIGSKSSINFEGYKNLLGTFNPPSEIFIDPVFLETLSVEEIKSGIGEMMHYFLTEGLEDASSLAAEYDDSLTDRTRLLKYIHRSLQIKKKTIELDEFDTDLRHKFNYGHTFGHAIESLTSYAIPHGQAVTLGMDLANFIALKRGMIGKETFDQMHALLKKNIPSFKFDAANIDSYCQALSKDKKNKGGLLGCILPNGPGLVEKYFLEVNEDFKNTILEYSQLIH